MFTGDGPREKYIIAINYKNRVAFQNLVAKCLFAADKGEEYIAWGPSSGH